MKMKKFLNFIFVLALLFNILPTVAVDTDKSADLNMTQESNQEQKVPDYISKSEFPVSAIDPTASNNPLGAYYPGFRAGNQLIVYTPKYGERTGTNEFGSEVTVEDGVVVSTTGSNSLIPSKGYIISGHGRAKSWINKNLAIGTKVCISPDFKTVESTTSPESYIFKAEQSINAVSKLISDYKKNQKDYQAVKSEEYLGKAAEKLAEAKEYINRNDYEKGKDAANAAVNLTDQALYNAIPSKEGEFHGIWLRPTQKNKAEIASTLDKLKNTGITNVFVETYYQGYTIFPSRTLELYGVVPQKPEFKGWDPLQAWIEEAHKRNMKVHVWFQTFYTGNENLSKNPNHVISAHPDWVNVQRKNYSVGSPMPSGLEHGGYFLDPANPQAQNYILCLITEIVDNYAIDGLNIDYIRYPASLPGNFPAYLDSTWGYTNFARTEFMSLYGVDPVCLTTSDLLWQKWVEYRQGKVTSLVSNLKSIVGNKKILIFAVIFPNAEESSVAKLQNWKAWGDNEYVDAFTPLVMGSDVSLAEEYVTGIKEAVAGEIIVYPGLFEPFVGGTPADMLYQINVARNAGAAGFVIFDYAHINKNFTEALGTRAFSQK